MNPTARRLYNLSLAFEVLALACCLALITSDFRGPLIWIWFASVSLSLFVARACLGFAETEARRS